MLARANGFDVRTATSPAAVLALCEAEDFDVCLIDLNYARDTTSGSEGMDLLARLRELDPTLPVVVMTAWGSIEGAVEAIRRGARDYVQKPWDNARLRRDAARPARAPPRAAHAPTGSTPRPRARGEHELPAIVAQSRAMQQVMALVERVAPSNASVLITGEHGTGKEVVARALHAASARRDKAFVAVNAGGLVRRRARERAVRPRQGRVHRRAHRSHRLLRARRRRHAVPRRDREHAARPAGAPAARAADRRVPPGRQLARRAASTSACSPRPTPTSPARPPRAGSARICSTGSTPSRSGCRRCASAATTSPISRARSSPARGGAQRRLSAAAMEALLAHRWPGNVRELEHVIERAEPARHRRRDRRRRPRCCAPRGDAAPRLEEMTLEQVERYLIERALAGAGRQRQRGRARARACRAARCTAGSPASACGVRSAVRTRRHEDAVLVLAVARGRDPGGDRAAAGVVRRLRSQVADHADARDRRSAAAAWRSRCARA